MCQGNDQTPLHHTAVSCQFNLEVVAQREDAGRVTVCSWAVCIRLGLAHRTHAVAQIAAICCAQLRQEIDAKGKKSALNDYLSFVERYFVVCADPRRVVLKRSRGVQGARPIRACALAQRDRLRPESTG